MTWIEEHLALELPEIISYADILTKYELGGYECQSYSRALNKVIVKNDMTAIHQDLKSIGLKLSDFDGQLSLFQEL